MTVARRRSSTGVDSRHDDVGRAAPHERQNASWIGLDVPQLRQAGMSVAPHEPQNRCSVPLSTPQDGQVTTPSISMGVYVRAIAQVVSRCMGSRSVGDGGRPHPRCCDRGRGCRDGCREDATTHRWDGLHAPPGFLVRDRRRDRRRAATPPHVLRGEGHGLPPGRGERRRHDDRRDGPDPGGPRGDVLRPAPSTLRGPPRRPRLSDPSQGAR